MIELSRSHAIWWEIVQTSNSDRFSQTISDHEDYFATVTQSLFAQFIVIAYQLFERRKDTISLRTLVDDLEATDTVLASELRAAIDDKLSLTKKAFSIRNKVYAHRNRLQTPEAVFATAGLSPDSMREIIDLARDVICALAEAANVETKAELEEEIRLREKCSREDTHLIMQALTKRVLMK